MELQDKVPFQIHGVITSDSDSDMESKNELDEEYHSLKPPPIDYELIKHNIIKIPAKKPPPVINVWEKRMKLMANKNKKDEQIEVAIMKKKKKKKSKCTKHTQETLVLPNNLSCETNNTREEKNVIALDKLDYHCHTPNINMNINILEDKTTVLEENVKKKRKKKKKTTFTISPFVGKAKKPSLNVAIKANFSKIKTPNNLAKKKKTFTTVENKMFNETPTISPSVGQAKKPSLNVAIKANFNKIKTPNSLAKKKKKMDKISNNYQLDIEELNKIEKESDKLNWPDVWHAGMNEHTVEKELKRLKKREKEIYENWFRQHTSLQNNEELGKNMVEKSNNIESIHSVIQTNNFGIIRENKNGKKKKAKAKQSKVNEAAKNIEDKTITNLSNKPDVKPKQNFEGTSKTKINKPNTKTNENLGELKKSVAVTVKREQPKKLKTKCNQENLPKTSKIEKINVLDRNESKNMQKINMTPNKNSTFLAISGEANNHCKALTNWGPDKKDVSSTSDNIFGDGFRDFVQNMFVKDGHIKPGLSNFTYEKLHCAYSVYQQKLINDQNKNIHQENNTVSEDENKKELVLKQNSDGGNKQLLHCLRNLNSEVRCHYYEFEEENFHHVMDFKERYLYMSLEEDAKVKNRFQQSRSLQNYEELGQNMVQQSNNIESICSVIQSNNFEIISENKNRKKKKTKAKKSKVKEAAKNVEDKTITNLSNKPDVKFLAISAEANNHCKGLTNGEPDKNDVSSTSDSIFDDGFRDFVQNMFVKDGHIKPGLSNFTYEKLYSAYSACQEKFINNQNKNVRKENNTVSEDENKKELVLKQNSDGGNRQLLQCLKNLNSEVRCHYYEFEEENFHHFMDFRERYLYMSLEEDAKVKNWFQQSRSLQNYEELGQNMVQQSNNIESICSVIQSNNFEIISENKNMKKKKTKAKKSKVKEAAKNVEDKTITNLSNKPDVKFLAISAEANNHCKGLTNGEPDKKDVSSTSDNIFNDEFRDFVQNMFVKDGHIKPGLSNFTYEKLYSAYSACQEKFINNQNKNARKENNTVSEDENKKELVLKPNSDGGNRQLLQCLKNLNSEVRCHYYEFEEENFHHFMDFRERYLYMSLEEHAKVKNWFQQSRSLQNHEELGQNMVQQSSNIESICSVIQSNNFEIISENKNRKKKKTKAKKSKVKEAAKNVEDKTITDLSNKPDVKHKQNFEETSKTKINNLNTKTNETLNELKKSVAVTIKREDYEQPKMLKTNCNQENLLKTSKIEKISVVDRNESKNMQKIDMTPNKNSKFLAISAEANNRCKGLTNGEPDKKDVSSTSDDGFRDFVQNMFVKDGHIKPGLSNFTYEKLYSAYSACQEKFINNQNKNVRKENNTVSEDENKKELVLKPNSDEGNRQLLQCLKNLNSEVRCHYYEFEEENFHHFMDFRERYLYMSLEEDVKVTKRTGSIKEKKMDNINECHLSNKDNIDENDLCMSLDNTQETKKITEVKSITTLTKCDIKENYSNVKKDTIDDNYSALHLKLIHLAILLFSAYLTNIVVKNIGMWILEYYLYICLFVSIVLISLIKF